MNNSMIEAVVENESGRLDKVASQLFGNFSRSQLKELLASGNLLVNGQQKSLSIRLSQEIS